MRLIQLTARRRVSSLDKKGERFITCVGRVEILRQIGGIELAFDRAVATEQAAISDIVPLRDQVGSDEDGLPPLRFEMQRFLEPLSPGRIEAQPRLVEQK